MTELPTEITLGPFLFVWDSDSNEMFLNRGEDQVGYVDHVYEDTWRAFVYAARPYQGPG